MRHILIWHSEDGSVIACKDKKFRRSVFFGTVSTSCKLWKSKGWAKRFADKKGLDNYTIKTIRDGQSVDCFGNVTAL